MSSKAMSSEPSFEVKIRHQLGEQSIAVDFTSSAKLTALIGPSGIGKTCVLNAIAGLIAPDEGRICAGGKALFNSKRGVNIAPEKRRAGYVFQDGRLFPHMKVLANLAYGEKLALANDRWISRDEVVDLLDIGHLLSRLPINLSGGEVRRVAIGRALLSAPRFLLMDEPFASLDEARTGSLFALIERIRDELDVPILLVSHDRDQVGKLAGEVVEMTTPPSENL